LNAILLALLVRKPRWFWEPKIPLNLKTEIARIGRGRTRGASMADVALLTALRDRFAALFVER